jgi:lactate permease
MLFTEFQLKAALALALPPTLTAAARGFGAAIGNVLAPHNTIAGSATVGLVGREGDILRCTILAACLNAAIGGTVLIL